MLGCVVRKALYRCSPLKCDTSVIWYCSNIPVSTTNNLLDQRTELISWWKQVFNHKRRRPSESRRAPRPAAANRRRPWLTGSEPLTLSAVVFVSIRLHHMLQLILNPQRLRVHRESPLFWLVGRKKCKELNSTPCIESNYCYTDFSSMLTSQLPLQLLPALPLQPELL